MGRAFTVSKYTEVSLRGIDPYKIATYVSKISLEWQYFRAHSKCCALPLSATLPGWLLACAGLF